LQLIDLAKRECLLQAEQADVVAGYLAGSVALGIGIVLATAAILYPVVARLVDRLEDRERLR